MVLTGQQRIAVLLLAMGDKFTADVFKRMERQEIANISKAIVELPSVPKETVEEVLREFHESLVEGVDMISGGSDILKRLLVKNLDPETAKYIMDALNLDTGPAPFRELEQVSPRLLSQILRNEHPQTLALIMGHLNPDQAANLLTSLPAGVLLYYDTSSAWAVIQQVFITKRVMEQAKAEEEARLASAPVEVDVVRRERKARPHKKH